MIRLSWNFTLRRFLSPRERSSGVLNFTPYNMNSRTLRAVIADLESREEKGRAEYGTTVDRTDLSPMDWEQHLYEELLDSALYLKRRSTMDNLQNLSHKVESFNRAFNLPIRIKPQLIKQQEYELQYNLLREELGEYGDACVANDLNGIADAIGDMLYVLLGMAIRHGLQDNLEAIFNEIHESNMSKLENGMPIYNEAGKVMKSNSYKKPNLENIIYGNH
jgi:NTP pyrophosphatase (non-canonical NTP hydrolase)